MSGLGIQIVIVLLLIVVNGLFALAEMAIAASRKARLQQRAEEGDAGARAALDLSNAPSRFLSTVQIGITLIGILTGAFGGTRIAGHLAGVLRPLPVLGAYSEGIALALVVVAITYLSLVIGELVPKRLALANAERLAAMVARPMQLLSTIASPAVGLLSASTDLVLRLLGARPSPEPAVTEEEITILIEQGARAGVFHALEEELVERVFRLGDRGVDDLMTPRPRIVWVDVEAPDAENRRLMATSGHTFFPVCRGELDQVLGIVSIKDLWARQATGEPADLQAAMRRPLFVPETISAFKLLESFQQTGEHVALVVDEYGGVEGLMTLIDILEALVGDVPAAGEAGDPRAVRREDGSWLVDGMLPIEEAEELFQVVEFPAEARGEYQTLGGFLMAQLSRIPAAGDRVDWAGTRFEVVDMDGNRVDTVMVMPVQDDGAQPASPPE